MYFLYNLLLFIVTPIFIVVLFFKMIIKGKYRTSIKQKLGLGSPVISKRFPSQTVIWLHAVSVGEVKAIGPVVNKIKEKYKDFFIVFSTGTETGQVVARKYVPADVFIYYPLDIPRVVKKVLNLVKPAIFITTETELWPNFLRYAKKLNVKTMLVNGRLSDRSIPNYRRTKFFWIRVLENIDLFSMSSEEDALRMESLGVRRDKIFITGNTKFDQLLTSDNLAEDVRKFLFLSKDDTVLVAGSTHSGEDEIVLNIYIKLKQKFPDLFLIVAPRHLQRIKEIEGLLKKNSLDFVRKTELSISAPRTPRPAPRIIILDTIGELGKIYGIATLVICGGSFVDKGGQNILEPAAWGKVVIYGPYMSDFIEAKNLLEKAGSGIQVKTEEEVYDIAEKLLSDPAELTKRGLAGRRIIEENKGASDRNVELMERLVRGKGRG